MPTPRREVEREVEPDAGARPATSPAPRDAGGTGGELITTAGRVVFIESPARLLHEQLASRLEASDAIPDTRWPGIARVGFIVGSSLALWAAMIGTVAALTA